MQNMFKFKEFLSVNLTLIKICLIKHAVVSSTPNYDFYFC